METEKRQLNKSQGSHEKPASDIWASAFDVAQCVGEDPPPFQLKATAQLKPDEDGETFPYKGYVREDAWSSGFYSAADKGTKTHDLPKGTQLKVLGREGGWLKVKVIDGKAAGKTGYISQERVSKGAAGSQQGQALLDGNNKAVQKLTDPQALFYTQVGGRLIVLPASALKGTNQKEGVNADQVVHAFKERGSEVTVVYVTQAGDPTFDPIKWYSDASKGGMIDIWTDLMNQYGNGNGKPGPKPWNPGNQPPSYYIGNDAHKEIAAHYRLQHGRDTVFTNNTPIATMLDYFVAKGHPVNRSAATAKELSDKPDILNGSLEDIYEIKPWTDAAGAAAKLTYYTQIFLKVGIPIKPGPSTDLGVIGSVSSPGGLVIFMSPAPGIVLYKRQQAPRRVPVDQPVDVPVPVPVPKTEPKSRPFDLPIFKPTTLPLWDLKYWENVTKLNGAALLAYLIISEGSRLFPPRNLLPIP